MGWSPPERICALLKETPEISLSLSITGGRSEKIAVYNLEEGPHPNPTMPTL